MTPGDRRRHRLPAQEAWTPTGRTRTETGRRPSPTSEPPVAERRVQAVVDLPLGRAPLVAEEAERHHRDRPAVERDRHDLSSDTAAPLDRGDLRPAGLVHTATADVVQAVPVAR